MFKTMVLICSLSVPNMCMKFEDTESLRATEEQCKMRAGEMLQSLSSVPLPIPPPYSAGYRCVIGEKT